jgi:hypothetical protein
MERAVKNSGSEEEQMKAIQQRGVDKVAGGRRDLKTALEDGVVSLISHKIEKLEGVLEGHVWDLLIIQNGYKLVSYDIPTHSSF